MTSKKEQFYIQRISELEAQLKQRDERIAALEKQVAELSKVNAEPADKVAKLPAGVIEGQLFGLAPPLKRLTLAFLQPSVYVGLVTINQKFLYLAYDPSIKIRATSPAGKDA